jgi:hypothetical protein
MSGTVDFRRVFLAKRVFLAVMAAAALVVVLAVPYQAQAASDCSSAGSDPTAAQYCPPTEPQEEEKKECSEGNSGNSGNSEDCSETAPVTSSSNTTPTSSASPATSEGGSLPFTGEEIPMLLAIAAAFIGAGIVLQRLSRPKAERS